MNSYVTGQAVRRLREEKKITQQQLADAIGVTPKAVSRWETGRGLPDISLLDPLAAALGVSVAELMSGSEVKNRNVSANLLRGRFFVCPVCGNIIHAAGEAMISCCGIRLTPLVPQPADKDHAITIEPVEDEHFLTVSHPMEKDHFLSFLAWVTGDRIQLVKLYPEGNAETRLQLRGFGKLYLYCSRHGLMEQKRT
ncbi:MAG: helix-turn-helix domain-containing protein [Oscillospiraceae bacterium]|nr:helix-turn-helix domain-containing protein [Oscillospiraceae bacterium]MBQ3242340.1 helix-turn-helix domain-containing protein [Oscillospiraceae bacterium]MBQ7082093.1 helix-turn-helix domain-containing protein [Oscillospiraceae bacterium]